MNARISTLSSPFLLCLLAACGGGGGGSSAPATPSEAEPTTLAVALDFGVQAGSQPVACGTPLPALGTGATAAELRDLRFYVSGLALINSAGTAVPVTLTQNEWQYRNVALLDFENGVGACSDGTAATNTRIVGTVPAGTYTGVELQMGVPVSHTAADGTTVSLNHTDTAAAPAPLDIQAMTWSWQAGRKFAKIEVNPAGGMVNGDGTVSSTFNFHLGSTGCTGNPATGETVSCSAPNRMGFHFHAFDQATQKIVLDISRLFETSNIAVNAGGASGCMAGKTDPECPVMFTALQVDIDSGLPIDEGHEQTIFSVAAK